MKFYIDDLKVFFPYPLVYKEQYEYMKYLKKSLDLHGHAVLEMPTGTGKTVSLLSLFLSYLCQYPDRYTKLIYCTRTVAEMEKTLEELKFVIEMRKKEIQDDFKVFAVGLSARRNLCIHPSVKQNKERDKVDALCRKLTSTWARSSENSDNCEFFEGFFQNKDEMILQEGVYTLEDLRNFGEKNRMCPYFLSRQLIANCNVVVYNYMYLLDSKISDLVTKHAKKESIVVFDEAHNIDDACIEAFTVKINRTLLDHASKNLEKLKTRVDDIKKVDISKLENEYQRLLKGLQDNKIQNQSLAEQSYSNSVVVPQELAREAIPGNIRKADHFVTFLKRIVVFLKNILKSKDVRKITTTSFLDELSLSTHIDKRPMRFCSERLSILLNTLEISETDEFSGLITICEFATSVATPFPTKFTLILEPNPNEGAISDPILSLACLDSSLAMQKVFERFKSVILTSGTMSPMDMYPKILDFKPVILQSIGINLQRNPINPLVVSRGSDQNVMSSEFSERNNKSVMRNYGTLLVEFCQIVPDGIALYLYQISDTWKKLFQIGMKWVSISFNQTGILDQILEYKLLYIESKDSQSTSIVTILKS